MKRAGNWFDFFRNFLVTLLLVSLGVIIGFRYANEGKILGLKILPLDKLLYAQGAHPLAKIVGATPEEKVASMNTFWEVWSLLDSNYLDESKLDDKEMINGAIGGMVAGIGDPYTMYLPPADNKETSEDLAGSFFGVGIELGYIDNTLAVVAPIEGGPGEKAGLQAGDLILHVKDENKGVDEDTTNWSLTEAVQTIRGERGVPVTLTIFRPGSQSTQDFTIARDEIVVETVKISFIPHNGKQVAHLKITRFGERTSAEWKTAVNQILAQKNNISGIVLDLRNNPGGFFDTSIEIASDFIANGVVVSQQSKTKTNDYKSNGSGRLATFPTIILVNKGSASASEIVAGALRDDLNYQLVGEQTFGKGTVQDRIELSNGGGLHITVGRWLTPDGNWIHDDGLKVDVEIVDDSETEADEVLDKALSLL